jgi:hypothetical protein
MPLNNDPPFPHTGIAADGLVDASARPARRKKASPARHLWNARSWWTCWWISTLADGVSNDRKFNRRYDADSIDMLSPIFEKHHITKEMFDTTIRVYSQYPELFDEVYNEVLIKLNVMLDENDQKDPPGTP